MALSTPRRITLIGAYVLASAVLVAPVSALAQERQTETVDRSMPFPANGTLKLRNFSGEVRITGGSGSNFVMKAVRRGYPDRLKEIQLTVESSGSTITVEANKRDSDMERRNDNRQNNVVETDFEIQVPAGARLDIDTFSSDVRVTGVHGEQHLKTFSGDIIASGSQAPLTAYSFNGRVEVDATGQGRSPDLSAETFSGTIQVRLADNAAGDLEFKSFSGDLDSVFPLTLRSSSRRNVQAQLPGGSGRTLAFKSFSGDLKIVK